MKKNKIPVTIITGFLGAGKTTLLNKLIEKNPDKKFAIIENEFGDIGIDQDLVINAEDGIFEMANGCICCSLNSELASLLDKLIQEEYVFDHLLIETTGIAEPDSIAANFIGAGRETKFVLDGTICLADAMQIAQNLNERGEAVKQVSFSDIILLTKTDLVEDANLIFAKLALRKFNAEAPIVEGLYGNYADIDLLHLQAYNSYQLEKKLLDKEHHHHHHDDIAAHSFEFKEAIDSAKFDHWIHMLLVMNGHQVYRIKGILNLANEDRKVIFQSVRTEAKLDLGTKWAENEIRSSKIVFIGYNIIKDILEKGLKQVLV